MIICEYQKEKVDLIESSRELQQQTEKLSKTINNKDKLFDKPKDECSCVESTKNEYEETMIKLTKDNEDLIKRKKVLEGLVKQKEKNLKTLSNAC
jgi:hypothetical protein